MARKAPSKRSSGQMDADASDAAQDAASVETPDADNAVGYGRPPRHSQFKAGQSGNPKGRPKGARSTHKILHDELHQRIKVVENGRRLSMTKLEYLIRKLVNGAMQKGPKEFDVLLKLMQRFEMPPDVEGAAGEMEKEDLEMLHYYLTSRAKTPDSGEGAP